MAKTLTRARARAKRGHITAAQPSRSMIRTRPGHPQSKRTASARAWSSASVYVVAAAIGVTAREQASDATDDDRDELFDVLDELFDVLVGGRGRRVKSHRAV